MSAIIVGFTYAVIFLRAWLNFDKTVVTNINLNYLTYFLQTNFNVNNFVHLSFYSVRIQDNDIKYR